MKHLIDNTLNRLNNSTFIENVNELMSIFNFSKKQAENYIIRNRLHNNLYEEYIKQKKFWDFITHGLNIRTTPKSEDSIFFFKDDYFIMEFNKERNLLYCRDENFMRIFQFKYNLTQGELNNFIKYQLENQVIIKFIKTILPGMKIKIEEGITSFNAKKIKVMEEIKITSITAITISSSVIHIIENDKSMIPIKPLYISGINIVERKKYARSRPLLY